jgi:glutamate N-acetyltransferase/amino-acid N-acetyltransferase
MLAARARGVGAGWRSLSTGAARAGVEHVRSASEEVFRSREEHRAFLTGIATLPRGFRIGKHTFPFRPAELPTKETRMTMTLIALDKPTTSFAGFFTSNAFPGHPVLVGRARLEEAQVGAVVINNKISNVGSQNGRADSERVCEAVASKLGLASGRQVIPCSTGIIGWGLPSKSMVDAVPSLVQTLQGETGMVAADGIMTTDLYPKLRSRVIHLGNGKTARVMGVAKGAGMVEPNLATMLAFVLTDLEVDRAALRSITRDVVEQSFNSLSIDADQSTSDTAIFLSSGAVRHPEGPSSADAQALLRTAALDVCRELAMDIVRNGEGVQHVIRVTVKGAPSTSLARATGKRIVNSPLFKTAVAGNDPNVGRLIMAIGNAVGDHPDGTRKGLRLDQTSISIGGRAIFRNGAFDLGPDAESFLNRHMRDAWMWESVPEITGPTDKVLVSPPDKFKTFAKGSDVYYRVPVDYPPHQKCVEIEVDFHSGSERAVVLGGDLTHEYITINADYRS